MRAENTRVFLGFLLVALVAVGCDGSPPADDAGADAGGDDASADAGDEDAGADPCELADDGASCDDGNACTEGDVCTGGTCSGAALDCSHLDAMCQVGRCAEGGCVSTPLSDIACDTGNFCSWDDACDAGACAAGTTTDCGAIEGGGTHGARETLAYGGTGGGQFADDCPLGQLPIGVEASLTNGYYNTIIHRFATRCGALALDGDTLTITPAARVPEGDGRGDYARGAAAPPATCPEGHVLAGFSGHTIDTGFEPHTVSQITVRCAPLTLEGTAEAGYTLSVGAIAAGPTVGTRTGSPMPETDCPTGMVARGTFGRAGEVLERFGLRCGTPILRVATTAPPAGTSSGAASNDDCPAGQVPVGVTASVAEGDRAGALTEYSTQCATLTVAEDEGGWSVTLTPGAELPGSDGHGTWETFGAATTARCPEGQVVVGASASAGAHVEALTLRCAAPVVTGDVTSGLTVGYGAAANGPSVGTGGSAFGPHDCPEGTLASGLRVYAGEVLDGIALRCAAVTPTVTAPATP